MSWHQMLSTDIITRIDGKMVFVFFHKSILRECLRIPTRVSRKVWMSIFVGVRVSEKSITKAEFLTWVYYCIDIRIWLYN